MTKRTQETSHKWTKIQLLLNIAECSKMTLKVFYVVLEGLLKKSKTGTAQISQVIQTIHVW